MTTVESPTLPVEAEPYVAAVRALLSSLPAEDRDDLVDDLSAHLAELAAEPGPPLAERLGPPSRYAAEFVASAGVDAPVVDASDGSAWRGVRDALRLPASARQRLADLRPAWLVMRPYLIVAGVISMVDGGFLRGDSDFAKLALVAVAGSFLVAVSTRIGATRSRWDMVWTVVAVVAAVGVANALSAGPKYRYVDSGYSRPGVLTRGDGTPVTNIWPYDKSGKQIDVYLFDQDGRPLDDLAEAGWDPRTGGRLPMRSDAGVPVPNLFPRGVESTTTSPSTTSTSTTSAPPATTTAPAGPPSTP